MNTNQPLTSFILSSRLGGLFASGLTLSAACLAMAGETGPAATNQPTVQIKASEGWVIFDPTKDGQAYRYGPSIIINPDGSLDAWFASPGGRGPDGIGQWDWIRHKHSVGGGRSWGPETVVLKPTEKSKDRMSVCDPGVVRFGGWYYLGVTAVDNPPGQRNEVFVARSKAPTGPFEKWNGAGWGGAPEPIVRFTTPAEAWGAGEPSFVVKDKTLFVYYTWWVTENPDGPLLNQTRVAVAPADDPLWPGKLNYQGVAFDRVAGEDSSDVKYIDAFKTFVAVSSAQRMSAEAHVVYRTSTDGLHFSAPARVAGSLKPWCHNVGISGTPEGHLDLAQPNFLAYAFSREPKVNWAFWYTEMHSITIVKPNR
jgi:hypothetical protein